MVDYEYIIIIHVLHISENFCEIFGFEEKKDQTQLEEQECIDKKHVPESLKKSGGGPIFVIDGGGPGGGAAIAGELYAYLEAGRAIPKAIVGSSIGSMTALYLQHITSKIPPLKEGASDDEIKKFDTDLRVTMMGGLKNMFEYEFEKLGHLKNIIEGDGKEEPTDSTSSKFFTFPLIGAATNIFEKNKNSYNHFDIGAITSIDVNKNNGIGYDENNTSYITYNNHISSDIIDASTAYAKKLGKTIGKTDFRDGNYGDFIKSLSNDISGGQKMVFFTTYEGNKTRYNFASLKGKVAMLEQNYSDVDGITGDDDARFSMTETNEIFNASLEKAREKY